MTMSVAHHFDDVEQQKHAATLGMWVFLASEVLFFGGLLAGYAVYRALYPEGFAAGSRHLDLWLGTLNTAVLLTSSLTVALSVEAIYSGNRRRAGYLLAFTIVLGIAFLTVKGFEYAHKYHEHLVPGAHFQFVDHAEGDAPPQGVELFFSCYFALTGLHAVHMVIGIGLFGVLVFELLREKGNAPSPLRIEVAGLYWHFVDVVWVFLFPLLYLIHVAE